MEHEHKSTSRIPTNGTRLTLIILTINFLVFFANIYLSNGYVSKFNYERDQKEDLVRREGLNVELRNVAIELKGINDHMQGDARQDKRLDDIEARLRDQERRR